MSEITNKFSHRLSHLLSLSREGELVATGHTVGYDWEIYTSPNAWVAYNTNVEDRQVTLIAFGDNARPSDEYNCPIRSEIRDAWDNIF